MEGYEEKNEASNNNHICVTDKSGIPKIFSIDKTKFVV